MSGSRSATVRRIPQSTQSCSLCSDQLGRIRWRLGSGVSQRRKRTTAQLVSRTCAAITARTCFHERRLVAVGWFAG